MLTLFKTLFEIILLRKGPADIPHSSVLFVLVTAIWILVGIIAVIVIESYKGSSLLIDLILALVGLGAYSIIVFAFGQGPRLMRCLTAMLGCSAVFSAVLFGERLALPMVLTASEVDWAVQLIWLWSIPVEGHIIARSIERQWFIGFLIALLVLIMQFSLFAVLQPLLSSAA